MIKIEQNYRSVQPILEVANQVIIHNEQRNPKNLWSTREGSDRVLLWLARQNIKKLTQLFHS